MRGTWKFHGEYILELRTEITVGCGGVALVIVLNEADFSANLGGITGPGSRPKRTGTGLFG